MQSIAFSVMPEICSTPLHSSFDEQPVAPMQNLEQVLAPPAVVQSMPLPHWSLAGSQVAPWVSAPAGAQPRTGPPLVPAT